MEKTRELYKQKYEAQLHEWSAKLEELKAHADKLTAEAKLDAKPHLDALHAKLAAAKAKLDDIVKATDDRWDDVKDGADHAWNDLKAAIEGAHDALVSRKKEG
jgi:uncharacterized coiled-coil DUF342 family protein